ncbi:hypothetical protein GCM10010271_02440 [Streptomyces kurssanovii]|nr:hypothetical protein GCM10010271_02440 [Streptomyces kurssanovii]
MVSPPGPPAEAGPTAPSSITNAPATAPAAPLSGFPMTVRGMDGPFLAAGGVGPCDSGPCHTTGDPNGRQPTRVRTGGGDVEDGQVTRRPAGTATAGPEQEAPLCGAPPPPRSWRNLPSRDIGAGLA